MFGCTINTIDQNPSETKKWFMNTWNIVSREILFQFQYLLCVSFDRDIHFTWLPIIEHWIVVQRQLKKKYIRRKILLSNKEIVKPILSSLLIFIKKQVKKNQIISLNQRLDHSKVYVSVIPFVTEFALFIVCVNNCVHTIFPNGSRRHCLSRRCVFNITRDHCLQMVRLKSKT